MRPPNQRRSPTPRGGSLSATYPVDEDAHAMMLSWGNEEPSTLQLTHRRREPAGRYSHLTERERVSLSSAVSCPRGAASWLVEEGTLAMARLMASYQWLAVSASSSCSSSWGGEGIQPEEWFV